MAKRIITPPLFRQNSVLQFEQDGKSPGTFVVFRKKTEDQRWTRLVFTAESHELMNILHGLVLYRKRGLESFQKFVQWITGEQGNKNYLTFTHKQKDGTTTNFGLSYSDKTGKMYFGISRGNDKISVSILPAEYLKIEKMLNDLIENAMELEVEAEIARRDEYMRNQPSAPPVTETENEPNNTNTSPFTPEDDDLPF